MRTQDVAAAQPTFSDEELETLFRTLGLSGDPHSEADRARLMEVLRDATEDPDSIGDLVTAIAARRAPTADEPAQPPLTAQGPFTPIRRRRAGNIDASILADVPTMGRDLNDTAMRALLRSAGAVKPTVAGGIFRGYVPQLEPVGQDRSSANAFIASASRALLSQRPPLWWRYVARFVEALKGEPTEGTWHTIENGVDVQLKHGPRRWGVSLVFINETVVLTVARENRDVVQCEVATTKPEEFSTTLLDALDGDVRSTQLALDAAQRGLTTDALGASQ